MRILQEHGMVANKMPLSGALPGYSGDIGATVQGVDRKLECKRRARAFSTLYGWMDANYALVVRDDRTEPLVVLRLGSSVKSGSNEGSAQEAA